MMGWFRRMKHRPQTAPDVPTPAPAPLDPEREQVMREYLALAEKTETLRRSAQALTRQEPGSLQDELEWLRLGRPLP